MCFSSFRDHMVPLDCVECCTYNGYHILRAYIQYKCNERMMSYKYKLVCTSVKYKCHVEKRVHIKVHKCSLLCKKGPRCPPCEHVKTYIAPTTYKGISSFSFSFSIHINLIYIEEKLDMYK